MTVQATFAATLVDEWVRGGVTDAVVAPGSRSTPLALALADSGQLRLHMHLDERAAGFYALGLGLATGRPAIVLTTSGTATAELLPSVVEAHHARVPLIVCTADRPPELHHVGAPQTIEQDALYGSCLRWRGDPGPADGLPESAWRSLASRVVAEATAGPRGPGPVQLNVAFRDPLVGDPASLPPGRPGGRTWHEVSRPATALTVDAAPFAGRRGVIVAVAGCGVPSVVVAAATALGWPVLADPRSGCRGHGPPVVAAFDPILRGAPPEPEIVLRLGAPPASRVLSSWLAGAADQVLVDPYGSWLDPERAAGLVLVADPTEVCRALAVGGVEGAPVAWRRWWDAAEEAAQDTIDSVLAVSVAPTEPGVARTLTTVLAGSGTLFVSSSMPIRDVEWFGDPKSRARVLANRGANGIDGVISTALGVAAQSQATVALVGDLAFLHDSGGLLGASRRGLQLVLVVVDNDGGGIFSFLPQAEGLAQDRFEQLFATPQGIDLAQLTAAHGLPTVRVETADQIGIAVQNAVAAGGVRVVLVATERQANREIHEELNAAVVKSLAGLR